MKPLLFAAVPIVVAGTGVALIGRRRVGLFWVIGLAMAGGVAAAAYLLPDFGLLYWYGAGNAAGVEPWAMPANVLVVTTGLQGAARVRFALKPAAVASVILGWLVLGTGMWIA